MVYGSVERLLEPEPIDHQEAKDEYTAASPLLRLALLFATRKLGNDERKHWRLAVSGSLEKLIQGDSDVYPSIERDVLGLLSLAAPHVKS